MIKSIKIVAMSIVIFFVFILIPYWAIAGARAGSVASLEHGLKMELARSLVEMGYLTDEWRNLNQSSRDLYLENAIYHYLQKNRRHLTTLDISEERVVDVAICLMIREGYRYLRGFFPSFEQSCGRYLR